MAVLDDLEKVAAVLGAELRHPRVVDNEDAGLGDRGHQLGIASVGARDGQLGQQPRQGPIRRAISIAARAPWARAQDIQLFPRCSGRGLAFTASTRRRARRVAGPEADAGPAGGRRPGRSQLALEGGRSGARIAIETATIASSRCAESGARTSTHGWWPRAGHSRTAGTRGVMSPRRRRRRPASAFVGRWKDFVEVGFV